MSSSLTSSTNALMAELADALDLGSSLRVRVRVSLGAPLRKETRTMKMISVISSNVVAVGYKETDKELFVTFKNGSYVYTEVPKSEFEGLLNAPSKGKYIHQHIKGYYPYSRIDAILAN